LVSGRAEKQRRKQYLYDLLVSEQSAKEIRLFSLRDLFVGRMQSLLGDLYRQDRALALRQLALGLPAGLALAGTQMALIGIAAVAALHGAIPVGAFNRYMLAIVQLGGLIPTFAFSVASLHQGNLYVSQLFAFLATGSRVEARRDRGSGEMGSGEMAAAAARVVFDHVSFAYPGTDREVLHDVSFEVNANQVLGLVGGNGSGKSTIVKILAGLYEPTSGTVLVNGRDVRTLDRGALRANLSVIFQDFVVYHFSARENVGLGQLDYLDDDERIRSAARKSGLDRVVERLPDGFDTVLGRIWDKGHELSGGQRQLVALARALLRQAPVLVLDEPSSALDVQTETEFFARLLEGFDGEGEVDRCTILVSHRLSTVLRADHILVLKDGRLVEQGPHERLMAMSGPYAEMFGLQSAAYEGSCPAPAPAAVSGSWVQ
jgi:ATP-binding cassette subfamily B protein